jgi:hypothetical protein
VAAIALGLLLSLLPGSAPAATSTRTVRYGPISLAAGSATAPSMLGRLRFAVARPCVPGRPPGGVLHRRSELPRRDLQKGRPARV